MPDPFSIKAGVDPKKLAKAIEGASEEAIRKINLAIAASSIKIANRYRKSTQAGEGKSGKIYPWKVDLVAARNNPETVTAWIRMPNGKFLPVVGRNKPHTASAKGEAPARDTGFLNQRILHHIDKDDMSAEAGAVDVEYAPHLEDGTKHMDARPALGPAAEAEEPKLMKVIEKIIEGTIQ